MLIFCQNSLNIFYVCVPSFYLSIHLFFYYLSLCLPIAQCIYLHFYNYIHLSIFCLSLFFHPLVSLSLIPSLNLLVQQPFSYTPIIYLLLCLLLSSFCPSLPHILFTVSISLFSQFPGLLPCLMVLSKPIFIHLKYNYSTLETRKPRLLTNCHD